MAAVKIVALVVLIVVVVSGAGFAAWKYIKDKKQGGSSKGDSSSKSETISTEPVS